MSLPSPGPTKPCCDIVMKGGITSGVVFPLAIVELARRYQLKNLGGASAGAIAAALAAAAQHGETHGGTGFTGLAAVPEFLGGSSKAGPGSNLFHFFQPQPETKAAFATLLAGLGVTGRRALLRTAGEAVRQLPGWTFLGAIPGGLLAVIAVGFTPTSTCVGALSLAAQLLLAGALGIAGSLGSVGWRLVYCTGSALRKNRFGLCSGMDGIGAGDRPGLTPWLAAELDKLSGKENLADGDPAAGPLTFGDLWGPDATRGDANVDGERAINLEMMATCLSHGRPYRLPFRQDDKVKESRPFYFSPAEFRELFPASVVDWMVAKARPSKTLARHPDLKLCALPNPWDLPVVVAVRMSLSFPLLLSAVPLWSVDRTRSHRQTLPPERCWFSDGGICSNFPVHFFDSPLPRWPTFALNLRDPHPERGPIWMPSSNSEGWEEWWTRFDQGDDFAQIGGFLSAIFNAMQNWSDNVQLGQPGYRDRVAHLVLEPNEGGLNLDMPPELIAKLSQLGAEAGNLLGSRFQGETNCILDWDNHRWTRFRAATVALEEFLHQMHRADQNPGSSDAPYTETARIYGRDGSPSYPWNSQGQFEFARDALAEILALVEKWRGQKHRFAETISTDHSPRPRPELRIRPRL